VYAVLAQNFNESIEHAPLSSLDFYSATGK
jgi:hypothetical protein